MGRKPHSDYIGAANEVFDELGVETLRSKDLVAAAKERCLIDPNAKYSYNHMLNAVRNSEQFDTTARGYVTRVTQEGTVAEESEQEVQLNVPELPDFSNEEESLTYENDEPVEFSVGDLDVTE